MNSKPAPYAALLLAASLCIAPQVASSQTLTLADAIATADRENLDIAAARERVTQAELMRQQALAMLRPTVTVSGTYTLRDREIELDFGNPFVPLAPYLNAVHDVLGPTDPTLPDPELLLQPSEPQVIQHRHDVFGSVSVDQSLYNARALPYIRQARVGIDQAHNATEIVRFEMSGAITQAYFGAVLRRRLVEVSERNVEMARLAHSRASIAYEEDVGTRFEANRAQVDLSRAERELENARTGYEIARRQLAALIGTDADFDVVQPDTITLAALDDANQSWNSRPDVIAHELEIHRHELRAAESRAQWIPNFYAHAQANVQRASAFSGDRFVWFLQIGANWTAYDGGVRTAQARGREREAITVELQRENTLRQIRAAIDATTMHVEQLQRDISSAEADVALARENLELTDLALNLGIATTLDTMLAREQLYLSELSLVTAEVTLQERLYELRRIVGVDLEL